MEILEKVQERRTKTGGATGIGTSKPLEWNVVVFDFGAGRCDVCLATIEEGVVEVKGTAGDDRLGGRDVDNILVEYLAKVCILYMII